MSDVAVAMNSFLPWRISFWIVMATIVTQSIFSASFYRFPVGPIYLTEFFILLAWAVASIAIASTQRMPRMDPILIILGLSIGYLVWSFFQPRELRWIIRQAGFVIYMSLAVISFVYVRRFHHIKQWHTLMIGGLFFGFLNLIRLYLLIDKNIGHIQFSAVSFAVIGFSYILVALNRSIFRLVTVIIGIPLLSFLTTSTSYAVAPCAVLIIYIVFEIDNTLLRWGTLALGLTLATIAGFTMTAFSDHNAMWRFNYWSIILNENWSERGLILGRGFGVPYFPKNSKIASILLENVSSMDNINYQRMAVSTHNGLLTMMYHIGIIGVIALLAPIWSATQYYWRGIMPPLGRVLYLATCGIFVLVNSNVFLQLPYAAPLFWVCYGGMLGVMSRVESKTPALIQRQ